MRARFRKCVGISIRQAIKLYSIYWIVFIVSVPVGILVKNWSSNPADIIKSLFFGDIIYCGEWWYISQYLKYLAVYPFLDVALFYVPHQENSKQKKAAIVRIGMLAFLTALLVFLIRLFAWQSLAGTCVKYIANTFYLYRDYTYTFIIAFLIRGLGVFEQLNQRFFHTPVTCVLCILIPFLFRWFYVSAEWQVECDPYITPVIVFGIVGLMRDAREGRVYRGLTILGKYSTWMWLTHTFWIYYFFQDIVLIPRISTLVYFWSVILSLCTALVLSCIYARLGKRFEMLHISIGHPNV